MAFINSIITSLGSIADALAGFFGNLFSGVIGLIYDGEQITEVGLLLLIGIATGLFFFVLRWIKGLINFRGR